MRMCVSIDDASMGCPTSVGDADGVSRNGARFVAYHLYGVGFDVAAGFFDDDLTRFREKNVRIRP